MTEIRMKFSATLPHFATPFPAYPPSRREDDLKAMPKEFTYMRCVGNVRCCSEESARPLRHQLTQKAVCLTKSRPRRALDICSGRQDAASSPPLAPGAVLSWSLDDDVYYYIGERLKLEEKAENKGVCTKERKGVAAEVLMPTPSTLVHFLFLFLFLRVIRYPFRTFASLPGGRT